MKREKKAWTGNPTVRTRYGTVKGAQDQANIWAWKAIPFAKPPVGDLRWKAPRDPDPWDGVRAETEYADHACQPRRIDDSVIGSEDCLYLNVWRPQSQDRDLPVYFWIHGGGNFYAGPFLKITPGANIARQSNMVVVTSAYRLGAFGWFSHPALRTGKPGDEYDDSGNYGLLDQIKALKWVRDNIDAFGGSPDNVFIAGESAGAADVLALIMSPAAKNLFHKAMAESGGARTCPIEEAEANANLVMAHLLVNDGTSANLEEAIKHRDNMTLKEIAKYLRSKPFAEFEACRRLVPFVSNFADGAVLPAEGVATIDAGTYPNKVPLIIGNNKEETKMTLFFQNAYPDDDELYQHVAMLDSEHKKATTVDGLLRRFQAVSDQPDVHGYQFCWGAQRPDGKSPLPEPYASRLGASHVMEIPFLFKLDRSFGPLWDKHIFNEKNRRGREALSNAMMAYVAQFVHTGDPNKPGTEFTPVKWLPWSNEIGGPKCIIFDVNGDVADIRMTTEETTEEAVQAKMDALPESLRKRVKEAIETLMPGSAPRADAPTQ